MNSFITLMLPVLGVWGRGYGGKEYYAVLVHRTLDDKEMTQMVPI